MQRLAVISRTRFNELLSCLLPRKALGQQEWVFNCFFLQVLKIFAKFRASDTAALLKIKPLSNDIKHKKMFSLASI
jgi:hypothetical protein